MAQIIDGYAWMKRSILNYARGSSNAGMVDDNVIADAITDAERWMHDEVMASGVEWTTKYAVVDDSASSFGTLIDKDIHRYLVVEDMGLLDFAKVHAVWRVDPAMATVRAQIHYTTDVAAGFIRHPGSLVGPDGEFYSETTGVNSDGEHEQALLIFNKGIAKENGHVGLQYWWYPPKVEPVFFSTTNAAGNLVKGPQFPRPMWPHILAAAKWDVSIVTGDLAKQRAMYYKFKQQGGVMDRVREFLGHFQSSEPQYITDRARAEG